MFIFSSVHKNQLHDSKMKPRAKNTKCQSGFVVTIFNKNFWKSCACGWSAAIEINWNHNHDTGTAMPLSMLPVDESVRNQFRQYFEEFQMGPPEAQRHHQSFLELSEDYSEKLAANSRLNPTMEQVRYLYKKWRQENFGERSGVGMEEKLQEKISDYAKSNITVSSLQEPFTIVIVTPLMKRAHGLEQAERIAFVDTTSCCDSQSNAITFLFTPCSIGAVPLGVIITKSEDSASYAAGFHQLRELLGSAGFGGRGYPAFFITDESAAKKNALSIVFPESAQKLCFFHKAQANWRWLCDQRNGVRDDRRQLLMQTMRELMYAKTVPEFDEKFHLAQHDVFVQECPAYLQRLHQMVETRTEWSLAFRLVKKKLVRGDNQKQVHATLV